MIRKTSIVTKSDQTHPDSALQGCFKLFKEPDSLPEGTVHAQDAEPDL